eukprot:UN00507
MALPILSPIITFFPATTTLVHIAITVTITLWLPFSTAFTTFVYFKRRATFFITSRWSWITSSTAKVRKRWLFSTIKISDPPLCLSYWHVGFLVVKSRAKVITSFFVKHVVMQPVGWSSYHLTRGLTTLPLVSRSPLFRKSRASLHSDTLVIGSRPSDSHV